MDYPIYRPNRVTWLAVIAFFFAAWNAIRLGQTIFLWQTLHEYQVNAAYIAITGAIWMVIGLLLTWGFWTGRYWAWIGGLAAVGLYTVWYWLDRLFIQQTPHSNVPYSIGATLLLLAFFLLILLTPKTRHYFRR